MDGMPYYYQVPGRNWQYGASPWGRNGVMRSPYEAEEVDLMTEPYAAYCNGSGGPYSPRHVASRQNRQEKPARSPRAAVHSPKRAAPSVVRRIVVTDGSADRKEQIKHEPSSIVTREGEDHGQLQVKEGQEVPQKQAPRKPRFENADAAANFIQRRYRGHQVRKTDPLKQLRVIKEVRDKLKEFQEQACDPEFLRKARDNKLERLRFDEGLMKEVLKLDSLQEVHPLVRDVRKATARDLVRLQDVTDAALASGMPISPDDLQCVDMPVDSPAEGENDMAVDGESVPDSNEATTL